MALPGQFISLIEPMQNFRKAPIRIIPNSSPSELRSNGMIKFMLPVGCVLDLRTLAWHFNAKTQLNNGDPATDAAAANVRAVGFPKYMQSLIQTLEIWVNNKNVTQINEFGRVYSVLQDFKKNRDRKLANNVDPSVYTFLDNTGALTVSTMRNPNTGTAAVNTNANRSSGDYIIDEWLGFLSSSSPSIIDTNILGQVEIVIKLHNGNNVLWGAKGDGTALAAADNLDFIIKESVMFVDKIDFRDNKYYDTIKALVSSEDGMTMAFKNYMYYQGDATTNRKDSTIKITESTQCLDKIIYTYYDNGANAVAGRQPLQLGNDGSFLKNYVDDSTTLTNSSIYFRRNGVAVGTVEFEINSQSVTGPLSVTNQWQQTLQAFELNQAEDLKDINPAMRDLNHYRKDFYVCALSTSHINSPNKSTVLMSGIDTQATSLNLVVKCTSDPALAADGGQAAVPVIITEFTSILRVTGQRQVMYIR
jgi:hypothetical protein